MTEPNRPETAHDGAYWDEVIREWEPTPARRLWREHSDALNIALLRDWLPEGYGRVLKTDLFDEASGSGLYPEMSRHAANVVGVDISRAVAIAARQRHPTLAGPVASVLSLPFSDGAFDAVISNSTLDHFDSDELLRAAIAELARVIRPGGRLIITLDNRSNPVVAARTALPFSLAHRAKLVPYFLGVTHGARWLRRALGDAGFEVADTRWVMHCPPRIWARLTMHRPDRSKDPVSGALRFEALARWPTRQLTGHFVCMLARRKGA